VAAGGYGGQFAAMVRRRDTASIREKSLCTTRSPGLQSLPSTVDRAPHVERPPKVITVPLFPGYAFVFVDHSRDSWQVVLRNCRADPLRQFWRPDGCRPTEADLKTCKCCYRRGDFSLFILSLYGTEGSHPWRVPSRFGRNTGAQRNRQARDLDSINSALAGHWDRGV